MDIEKRDELNRLIGASDMLSLLLEEMEQWLEEAQNESKQETLEKQSVITSPDDTRQYLSHQLRDRPHEVFAALFLDNRHQVIQFEELFKGTIDGASVYPREVVKKALQHNAAALIIAHNHPSGIAEPSQADQNITQRLEKALALVDIRLLDHLIIGDGEIVSLAECGML